MRRLWHRLFGHDWGDLYGHLKTRSPYADGSVVRYCKCGERDILTFGEKGD